jgi:hypothetical protein
MRTCHAIEKLMISENEDLIEFCVGCVDKLQRRDSVEIWMPID